MHRREEKGWKNSSRLLVEAPALFTHKKTTKKTRMSTNLRWSKGHLQNRVFICKVRWREEYAFVCVCMSVCACVCVCLCLRGANVLQPCPCQNVCITWGLAWGGLIAECVLLPSSHDSPLSFFLSTPKGGWAIPQATWLQCLKVQRRCSFFFWFFLFLKLNKKKVRCATFGSTKLMFRAPLRWVKSLIYFALCVPRVWQSVERYFFPFEVLLFIYFVALFFFFFTWWWCMFCCPGVLFGVCFSGRFLKWQSFRSRCSLLRTFFALDFTYLRCTAYCSFVPGRHASCILILAL